MPPSKQPAATGPKGSGKKPKGDNAQVSTLEFGLPTTMVTALQSISSRATQDLWGTSNFTEDSLTAEQIAQRQTNLMSKLAKRLAGNVKAKADLASALDAWFARLSQHMLGLVGRIRAIGAKVDEDLLTAITEMQQHLANQPSAVTSDQVMQASNAVGPIWTSLQEQEVLKLAAAVRAFSTVAAPAIGSTALPSTGQVAQASRTLPHADRFSEVSFGELPMERPTPSLPASTVATATVHGPRWKRRTAAPGGRPSKSPRRTDMPTPVPWRQDATGLTPEGIRRTPTTAVGDDDEELVQDTPVEMTPTLPSAWFGSWLPIADFAMQQGDDLVGELVSDPEQDAVLPMMLTGPEDAAAIRLAQQIWEAVQVVVRTRAESSMPALCAVMPQLLQQLRAAPASLSHVRQGVVLIAQTTLGNLLDPYSFAPATAQEWLLPATLVERGGRFRGYLPQAASLAPEVQGILLRPCPFLPQAEVLAAPAEERADQAEQAG